MIKEYKDYILTKLLPPEKTFLDEKGELLSLDDQKIVLGYNMYRDELIKLLKINDTEKN